MHPAKEDDRQALLGIAAMLLALAELAARASGRCLPLRCVVLWILRRAEAVALDYAAELHWELGADLCLPSEWLLTECAPMSAFALCTGASADDALHLARRLIALAAALYDLSRHSEPRRSRLPCGHFGSWTPRVEREDRELGLFLVVTRPAWQDTS